MGDLPQLREVGWLYDVDDPHLVLTLVRLFERADAGWEVHLNSPVEAETQVVVWPDEASARDVLAAIYADGGLRGRWRIRQPAAL
ncbi:hypothetical protein F8271_24960 [Micromonospora sp. ALFpr18c]|uniref:hypothetical protein n=1 Tax=unclassified Micromonospora TaxID=2617518 RepID=UPI00124B1F78|nr:hypothetical protein [Micromonospora sp. ALFpr18c]KAB1932921.1 hypothetical protein F8271_24960 [Micromonospora sp. ALFpr18c]